MIVMGMGMEVVLVVAKVIETVIEEEGKVVVVVEVGGEGKGGIITRDVVPAMLISHRTCHFSTINVLHVHNHTVLIELLNGIQYTELVIKQK